MSSGAKQTNILQHFRRSKATRRIDSAVDHHIEIYAENSNMINNAFHCYAISSHKIIILFQWKLQVNTNSSFGCRKSARAREKPLHEKTATLHQFLVTHKIHNNNHRFWFGLVFVLRPRTMHAAHRNCAFHICGTCNLGVAVGAFIAFEKSCSDFIFLSFSFGVDWGR